MLKKYKKRDMTLILSSCITDVNINIWRFQAAWPYICRVNYRTAMDESFTANAVSDVKDDVLAFANNQLLATQPRDDYKELLEITILFLGRTPGRSVHFMAPAAMHRARRMSKAIYAIKLWMFCSQFPLTKKEEKGLRDGRSFVVHVYLKAWFTTLQLTSSYISTQK